MKPATHPSVAAALAGTELDEYLEIQIAEELARQRVIREARRRLDAEERGPLPTVEIATLRERLARPRVPVRYRIEQWQPCDSRVMLAAQFKAGKSTLVGNALRALADGDRFLGEAAVRPVDGVIALLDFEMSTAQLDDWLASQHIRRDDRVLVMPMRGQASAFDILDPRVRATWVERFRARGVAYLALDCLRPILDALGLDEHRDAGRFLVALDALLREAGIPEALVVQHMGHLAERARGDSRLRDWPDVEWRLVRQDENPASERFLSAYGRDVDRPEARLTFDRRTRRLGLLGGSRRDVRTDAALEAVLDVLRASAAPMTVRGLQRALEESDHARDAVRAAIQQGVRTGAITTEIGPRRAILHRPGSGPVSECAEVCGERAAHSASECAAALIEPHTHTLTGKDETTACEPHTQGKGDGDRL